MYIARPMMDDINVILIKNYNKPLPYAFITDSHQPLIISLKFKVSPESPDYCSQQIQPH